MSSEQSVNIQVSVRQKEPKVLMTKLKAVTEHIYEKDPNSRSYLLGLNLEIELKKYINTPLKNAIPDDFYIKLD